MSLLFRDQTSPQIDEHIERQFKVLSVFDEAYVLSVAREEISA